MQIYIIFIQIKYLFFSDFQFSIAKSKLNASMEGPFLFIINN